MFGRSSGKIEIPSMPAALARIIQITNSPNATAEQVAGVVMLDQALSAKVLRLANSAFYGRKLKVETISEAVMTLGFMSVRNLAASASIVDALFPQRLFPGFNWQDMWVHSVTCAVASEAIYTHATNSRADAESAFVAGLLHDMGKLVIARALPQRFTRVVEKCREVNSEMFVVEAHLLGTDHARIAGDLSEQWQFPEKLSVAVEYHHAPDIAPGYDHLVRAVYAGNMLTKRLSRHYIQGMRSEVGLKQIAEAGGLRPEQVDSVVNDTREKLKQCGQILAWGNSMPGARIAHAA